jgi:tetratricopeptide (TPR) repeat protein
MLKAGETPAFFVTLCLEIMNKDQLKEKIDSLTDKAWNSIDPAEKRARLHELTMLYEQYIPMVDTDIFYEMEKTVRIHLFLNEFSKAQPWLQKMIQLQPEHSHACFMLSEVLYEKGEFEEALKYFDQGNPRVFSEFRYDFRAKINRALGKVEEAEKDQKIYDDYQAAEKAKWDDPNHYYHYM